MRSSAGDHCGGLAEVRRAIEELAADYAAGRRADDHNAQSGDTRDQAGRPDTGDQAARPDTGDQAALQAHIGDRADGLDDRLARIWMMISELDPDVARRLPGYGFPR